MLDDKEMLQFIMKTAEMGCRGINAIKHYANSEDMSNALRSQNIEYGRIYHNAYNMLRERNQPSCHVSPMSNSMAKMVVNRQMKNDSSDPHIAEMGSIQDWAGVYPLFHWSFIPWGFYLVLAVACGFMLHVRKRNRQKRSLQRRSPRRNRMN